MKKLLFAITLLLAFSCGEEKNKTVDENAVAKLNAYEMLQSQEESTRKFIEDYLRDVNSSNWRSKIEKYLQPDSEAFLEEHTAFRASVPNYKSTIKHLTVDGNEAIVWIHITANYAKSFIFKSEADAYGDNLLNGIEAKNQALSWDETWQFNVVDGKFGEQWDFLKDNHKILEDLKATKSP